MLKNILNLEGIAILSKHEQKSINGGIGCQSNCTSSASCPGLGEYCGTFECDGGTITKCTGNRVIGIGPIDEGIKQL